MNTEISDNRLPFDFLETDEEGLVLGFLERFLPPQASRHRNVGNEVNYVVTTLRRVFLRYFNRPVERESFFRVVCEGNYVFFRRHEADIRDPLSEVSLLTDRKGASEPRTAREREYSRVHVNVDGGMVRLLRALTLPVSPQTGEEKRAELVRLDMKLQTFAEQQGNGQSIFP